MRADSAKADSPSEPYYLIGSIVKAVSVLRAFGINHPLLGPTELSRDLKLSKTVAQRILLTLAHEGLLMQDPATRKYSLSPRVVELASSFFHSSPLLQEGEAVLRQLVAAVQATASLAVLDNDEVLYVASFEPQASVRATTGVGERRPLHASATGKSLLAFQPKVEQERLLDRISLLPLTEHTITDKVLLRVELEAVRERGYALNQEERAIGLCAVAAPVLDDHGHAVAAIGVGVPKSSLAGGLPRDLIEATLASSKRLSERLCALSHFLARANSPVPRVRGYLSQMPHLDPGDMKGGGSGGDM
ncbi:MAG: IclR family transcriptional regulator [Candidatus Bipolaricaulis sp.]|nr:IclR family transcriptional regulator [Candidatus Bipolaricaulis sp.]